jgi:phosphoribosyl-AMP cyclohydrolase / phosphoribosyl-ATP pyrophosphohydrolase
MSAAPGTGSSLTSADIARLDFAKGGGLLPALVQHAGTGAVLMLGFMNAEALRATLERRRVVFFSRTRQRLWEKGETSGHTLELAGIVSDCDHDALLVTAWPKGAVCHRGTRTCFGNEARSAAERVSFLCELERIVAQRIRERPSGSYTAALLGKGARAVAQKVGEEGLEVALAGFAESDARLLAEAADLLFHLLVLLGSRELPLERVVAELEARHGRTPDPEP